MIKYILLALLLININLSANDTRLEKYANTTTWLQDADTNADSAFNLGLTYHKKIKDYDKAEYWYKKAYKLDSKDADIIYSLGLLYKHKKNYKEAIKWYKQGINAGDGDSAFSLALLYEENLKDYPTAIKYYKTAYKLGHIGATYNLAMLYEDSLKDIPNAIKWYKIAINMGHVSAVKNLAYYYRNNGQRILAGAYSISLINVKYTKKRMLGFLKNKLKFTNAELQEAYKLQLKLDIPKHYKGGIN
jgi:hypothetical protein